tara:strand:+ start:304 stop:579 length:276 start_codon:yes stop_codon:yes gene_type:complete
VKLSKIEKTIFEEFRPRLRGAFTESKKQRLEAYSVERARWLKNEAKVKKEGETLILRDDKGAVLRIVENPSLKLAQQAQDRSLKLAKELGL